MPCRQIRMRATKGNKKPSTVEGIAQLQQQQQQQQQQTTTSGNDNNNNNNNNSTARCHAGRCRTRTAAAAKPDKRTRTPGAVTRHCNQPSSTTTTTTRRRFDSTTGWYDGRICRKWDASGSASAISSTRRSSADGVRQIQTT